MSGTEHWLTAAWPAPENVHAFTTLRTGGVSDGPFASLNMADHVGDHPNNVRINRERIKTGLQLPGDPFWLQQVHGNQALPAQPADHPLPADAGFTDQPGRVCAVLTADCLPLLACTRDGQQVAAVHGGWRGLLAGVISAALTPFPRHETLVWLGPAIGPSRFEVGAEVYAAFVDKSIEFAVAFNAQENGKYLADIYQLAKIELAHLGVNQIYGGGFCTVTDHRRFFSYRRDQQTGRMASLIWRD